MGHREHAVAGLRRSSRPLSGLDVLQVLQQVHVRRLPAEQGYDATTVAQIVERAGVTKSTFFRHFPDKRELLVAGQETLSRLLAEGIAEAPVALKSVSLAAAMTTALVARGVPDRTAHLAGELGVLAFKRGYAEWSGGDRDAEDELGQYTLAALDELRAASASLG